jgi:hypothetical protein
MREILNIRMLNVRAAPLAVLAGSDGAGRAGAECLTKTEIGQTGVRIVPCASSEGR